MSDDEDIDAHAAPLIEHLIELRQRLLRSILALALASVLGYFLAPMALEFLVAPLIRLYPGEADFHLIYLNVYEPFLTKLKLALVIGFAFAFPLIAGQVWAFVAPGLYRSERRALLPFLLATPLLFIAGGALVYYGVMPQAWRFFIEVGTDMDGMLQQTMTGYLSISIHLILAFGISFQLPVLLILLARVGLVSAAGLRGFRRYAVVAIFAFAAFVTPPDIISQLILGIPLLVLYEISVLGVAMVEKAQAKAEKDPI